jgi:hypothetical protein
MTICYSANLFKLPQGYHQLVNLKHTYVIGAEILVFHPRPNGAQPQTTLTIIEDLLPLSLCPIDQQA